MNDVHNAFNHPTQGADTQQVQSFMARVFLMIATLIFVTIILS